MQKTSIGRGRFAVGYTGKVYQFQEHNGKNQLIEIPCGQNGFAVPTFNNALDDIMGEAYMVQENSDE